ncbi:zinc ribbon domain-containing protein [candidate division KSB1 bacterium]|nr:zinc ribbon domain-containing protein [candidate division KSB1 bacterium]
MYKKKLLKKLALPALIVFVISILILLLQIPMRERVRENHRRQLDGHISYVTQQNQNLLNELAQQIKALPINPNILNEIQAKFFQETQGAKLYLWMSDLKGNFQFGVPQVVFMRLNASYEKIVKKTTPDDYLQSRDEFLSAVIGKQRQLDYAEPGDTDIPLPDPDFLRGFDEENVSVDDELVRPTSYLLSAVVVSGTGESLGNLFLKIDDSAQRELYIKPEYYATTSELFRMLEPLVGSAAGLSGLFLWFLLPTWVFIDAQAYDVKNPSLWAFLTLVSFVFGLTIYLIARPTHTRLLKCPQCERELNGIKAFCPYCGFDVASLLCPQCQYPVKADWAFCPSCRADLKQPTEKPAPTADILPNE